MSSEHKQPASEPSHDDTGSHLQSAPEGAPPGRWLKRFVVALIGGTVLLLGIAMIFLPGPALVVIPAGLAILATEFIWARRALRQCKGVVVNVKRKPWFRRFRRWRKKDSSTS